MTNKQLERMLKKAKSEIDIEGKKLEERIQKNYAHLIRQIKLRNEIIERMRNENILPKIIKMKLGQVIVIQDLLKTYELKLIKIR